MKKPLIRESDLILKTLAVTSTAFAWQTCDVSEDQKRFEEYAASVSLLSTELKTFRKQQGI